MNHEKGIIKRVGQKDAKSWNKFTFKNSYEHPAIFLTMMTANGPQPSHFRIKDITEYDFKWQIEEWMYTDGFHVKEDIGYFIAE